ncbi:hypothetical protein [Belnapia moabensis]|uniref:hypothetical protein n=1 Tax=Belnapia moabensis TaxID=365533 RepID=UPI0005BDAE77|nr:hypothetical protein [Belnapia moabensis]
MEEQPRPVHPGAERCLHRCAIHHQVEHRRPSDDLNGFGKDEGEVDRTATDRAIHMMEAGRRLVGRPDTRTEHGSGQGEVQRVAGGVLQPAIGVLKSGDADAFPRQVARLHAQGEDEAGRAAAEGVEQSMAGGAAGIDQQARHRLAIGEVQRLAGGEGEAQHLAGDVSAIVGGDEARRRRDGIDQQVGEAGGGRQGRHQRIAGEVGDGAGGVVEARQCDAMPLHPAGQGEAEAEHCGVGAGEQRRLHRLATDLEVEHRRGLAAGDRHRLAHLQVDDQTVADADRAGSLQHRRADGRRGEIGLDQDVGEVRHGAERAGPGIADLVGHSPAADQAAEGDARLSLRIGLDDQPEGELVGRRMAEQRRLPNGAADHHLQHRGRSAELQLHRLVEG